MADEKKAIEVITLDDEDEEYLLDVCDSFLNSTPAFLNNNKPSSSTTSNSNYLATLTNVYKEPPKRKPRSSKNVKEKRVKLSDNELLKAVDEMLAKAPNAQQTKLTDTTMKNGKFHFNPVNSLSKGVVLSEATISSTTKDDSLAIIRSLPGMENVKSSFIINLNEEDSLAIVQALKDLETDFKLKHNFPNVQMDDDDALAVARAIQELEDENFKKILTEEDSLAIAKALQDLEDNFNNSSTLPMLNLEEMSGKMGTLETYNANAARIKSLRIIDPQLEILDPNPDIYQLYKQFDAAYFNGVLSQTPLKICWAHNFYSVAGMFYSHKDGVPTISLSANLLTLRPRKDLVETFLHEMIHAYVYFLNIRDDGDHGQMFQFHMHRINRESGANITIYHSYHQEVSYLRKFIWRCTGGQCRGVNPYHGYVSLPTKRNPNRSDAAFRLHQQLNCPGTFVQVSNNFN